MGSSINKLIIIFISFSAISLSNNSRINRYPLAVGNSFVYTRVQYSSNFPPFPPTYDSSFIKCRISKDTIVGNKRYFFMLHSPIYYYTGGWFRLDSIGGRLLVYDTSINCNNNFHESIVDSLWADLSDSVRNCGYFVDKCIDTLNRQIFGILKGSLGFNFSFGGGSHWSSTTEYYSNDFGMTFYYNYGSGSITSGYTRFQMVGCQINGQVFGDTNVYPTDINSVSTEIPNKFSLSQNYPNPFNPTTKIKFTIPKESFAKIIVFDILGREVSTIINEELKPGTYEVDFDSGNLSSGIYYYKLLTGDYIETKKMVLIK